MDASEVKQLLKQSQRERLEILFLETWADEFREALGPLQRQFRHNPKRKWRWDFAHLQSGVLIDIQGGTFIRGSHSRGVGHERDYEKYNDAIRLGYRPLLFGTLSFKDPPSVVELVAQVICNAKDVE